MKLRFDNLSLRVKLLGVFAVIITLASCPVIWFGYEDTYERTVASVEERFSMLSRIVDECLQLSYLSSQTLLAEKVGIEKDKVSKQLDVIEDMLGTGDEAALRKALDIQAQWHTNVSILSDAGGFLYRSRVVSEALGQNVVDFLGIPVSEYVSLVKRTRSRELFSFVRGTTGSLRDVSMLLVLRKTAEHTIILLEELNSLEDAIPARKVAIEGTLQDVIRTIEIPKNATISVITGDGRFIASRGPAAFTDSFSYDRDLYAETRKSGRAVGHYDGVAGDTLYSIRHFKVLDWYIQASIPMTYVREPAQAYAVRIGSIVLGIFAIIAFAGLFLITRFLRPLRDMAGSAQRLERVDFASDNVSARLRKVVEGLPEAGRDEVGLVVSAFSRMVGALEKNIEELKHTVARQHSIEGELNAAREIQRGMLPPGDGSFAAPGFLAAALTDPAKEVGGDFYDVIALPGGRRALIVGDVSGKGVSAALLMSVTLTLVRTAIAEGLSPEVVMKRVNDQLAANNPSCMFVTLWIGVFDPATGRLDFANGGHCPPVVASPSGVRWLKDISGPLVGALDMAEFSPCSTELAPGEAVLIYTDGVSEAMNLSRTLFGEERIGLTIAALLSNDPGEILKEMMRAVRIFRGAAEQSDDITMLAFKRLPADEAASGDDVKGDAS